MLGEREKKSSEGKAARIYFQRVITVRRRIRCDSAGSGGREPLAEKIKLIPALLLCLTG